MSIFEPIFERLLEEGGRFVVVGGLAVVLQGHARLTVDLDLIVDLDPGAARKTIAALLGLGMRPLAPVDALSFADSEIRQVWIDEKGMRVFSLYDPENALRSVDLFVSSPIPFEALWERAEPVRLSTATVPVASIADLIHLKEVADRPQDRDDIEKLREILRIRSEAKNS
ncbi:MAG: nucleotidyl transferase AbiEii/AbiGii toxin family protein [Thermoanaerobaculia bacterium]